MKKGSAESIRDFVASFESAAAALPRSADRLDWLRRCFESLQGLELQMIRGQVIPEDQAREAREDLAGLADRVFEGLCEIDPELARWWLSLWKQVPSPIPTAAWMDRAARRISHAIEIPEDRSAIAPRLRRLSALRDELAAARRDWTDPVRIDLGSGHSPQTIARFERENRIVLPPLYRDFANRCGWIHAGAVRHGYHVRNLFAVEMAFSWMEPELRQMNPPRLPIASAGEEESFALELTEPHRVWQSSLEDGWGQSRGAAPDLAALLDRIADDWEHALFEDERWRSLDDRRRSPARLR